MGRFRIVPEPEHDCGGDQDDPDGHSPDPVWEFTAEEGEEGAIIVRESRRATGSPSTGIRDASSSDDDCDRHNTDQDVAEDDGIDSQSRNTSQSRRIYFWEAPADSHETGHTDDGDAEEDDYDSPLVPRRVRKRDRTLTWFGIMPYLVVFIAFLSWWIREGPPAPPPLSASSDAVDGQNTWSSFLAVHSEQWLTSSAALFYSVPAHILKWWALHIKEDLVDVVRHCYTWASTAPTPTPSQLCELSVPTSDLQNLIVGQDHATSAVSEALLAWESHRRRRARPLLLYLAGFPGTGRATLARRLHWALYASGRPHGGDDGGCRVPALLHLKGRDFAAPSAPHQLAAQIGRSEGTVLLESVEDMDPTVLAWLFEQLSVDDPETEEAGAAGFGDVASSSPDMMRLRYARRVVVLTSTAGSRSIARNLRQSLGASTLRLDLRHEVEAALGGAERIDAVVPFLPLTREGLRQILRRQVEAYAREHRDVWRSLRLTEACRDALLGPEHVEYLSWEVRGRPILTFASAGAAVLGETGPIWTKLRALVGRCQLAPHPDYAAVVDLPPSTEPPVVTISWCSDDAATGTACREACRLPY